MTPVGAAPAPRPADVWTPALDALAERRHTENFPVAMRLVPAPERRALLALYGFARFVDELGDAGVPESDHQLDAVAADVHRLAAGDATLPVVQSLAEPAARFGIPAEPLLDLIEANRRDQRVARYATFDELIEYCRFSADPVGRIVLCIFGDRTPDAVRRSDLVCSALQVIEHLQDVREDLDERGRIYLPQDDLARFGVAEAELALPVHPPHVRRLVRFEAGRAAAMLRAGGGLVGRFGGWRRLALAGYVSGGVAALGALERCGWDPGRPPRTASTARRLAALLPTLLRGGA